MSDDAIHRGVRFTVKQIAMTQWKWAILPPASVIGLRKRSGQIAGGRDDAIAAAKKEIEAQDLNRAD
jgi:hypothetical protein